MGIMGRAVVLMLLMKMLTLENWEIMLLLFDINVQYQS